MPVYLFTFHAYRSWNPDHSRGYVRRGQGILPADPRMARRYDRAAVQPPHLFAVLDQQHLAWIAWDACRNRGWRLHQIACDPTHVHVMVSWRQFLPWQDVRAKLKNLMSWRLSKQSVREGRRWFSAHGSRKRVKDRRHYDHLMNCYLPRYRGIVWREGDPPPPRPSASADG